MTKSTLSSPPPYSLGYVGNIGCQPGSHLGAKRLLLRGIRDFKVHMADLLMSTRQCCRCHDSNIVGGESSLGVQIFWLHASSHGAPTRPRIVPIEPFWLQPRQVRALRA